MKRFLQEYRASPTDVVRVLSRYWRVFRKNWYFSLFTGFSEPLLYLTAFGFGLGRILDVVVLGGTSVSYRAFSITGILAQTLLFQAFFECAFGGFMRMHYQRVFLSIAVTRVTLSEVLWAELLWGTFKSVFSASAVLTVGVAAGEFGGWQVARALPWCLAGGLAFSGLGLASAAIAQVIEHVSYPQYLLVFPMFLFCGVYFPIESLPVWTQTFVALLPLSPLLAILRHELLHTPVALSAYGYFTAWCIFFLFGAHALMSRRLLR